MRHCIFIHYRVVKNQHFKVLFCDRITKKIPLYTLSIILAAASLRLSVLTPLFYRHDRRTATKFGTHICGLIWESFKPKQI